jgi:hypothetical protein
VAGSHKDPEIRLGRKAVSNSWSLRWQQRYLKVNL